MSRTGDSGKRRARCGSNQQPQSHARVRSAAPSGNVGPSAKRTHRARARGAHEDKDEDENEDEEKEEEAEEDEDEDRDNEARSTRFAGV